MKTCGDCAHAILCEADPSLSGFSRENPAYCKDFTEGNEMTECCEDG